MNAGSDNVDCCKDVRIQPVVSGKMVMAQRVVWLKNVALRREDCAY